MQIHEFFLMLAVLLLTARLFSEVGARLGAPGVIGELAAGLLLGPSLLGWMSPDATMKLLAEIGVILLLFEVGMDTDVFRLAQTGAKPVLVALGGVLLPAAGGYAGAAWFKALLAAAQAAHPGVGITGVLDCGDEPGTVLAALRAGLRHLRFTGPEETRARLAAIAEQLDATVEGDEPVEALDLLDRRDAGALCSAFLAANQIPD